jgi:MFS family permease
MHGREQDAGEILRRVEDAPQARVDIAAVRASIADHVRVEGIPFRELLAPSMRLVLTIGVVVAVLQQITGINAVFFYAPMIFEQSGIGVDASFMQASLVGLTNLLFTIVAILLIDRVGRRPLLATGMVGIVISMFALAWGFADADYRLDAASLQQLPAAVDAAALAPLADVTYADDIEFREAVVAAIGYPAWQLSKPTLVGAAIDMNPLLVLAGVLGFVASFAISVGPVMWVLFSELFPNHLRGLAVSLCGLLNSATSFVVQLVFPWELENLGNSTTFLLYGLFAVVGLTVLMRILPETKGRSLEELETELVGR